MPVFTITVPAGEGTRVMNALCASAGIPATQANALQTLRDYMIRVVAAYERTQATNAAIAAVADPTPVTPT